MSDANAAVATRDAEWMEQALGLAEAAAAFASPNPTVGCVLVRDGVLLGEGAHRYDERDHAEIVALKQAAGQGHDVRGATAYVTLEPCSHHGRTGPCADALLAAAIARCVVATVDPNPLVRGGGIARLRAGGVQVAVLDPATVRARAAQRLNDAFAFAVLFNRPFVTLKAAVSADGLLAPAPAQRSTQEPYWLTGEAARADVQRLRHASDALLTGIGTVLADNPALSDRTLLPRRRPLLRVVLDSALRLPVSAKLVRSAAHDVVVFCSKTAPFERETALREAGVEVIRLPGRDGELNLVQMLDVLAQRGIRSVLAEGGSMLNGSLLRQDLADRLVVYRSPLELGQGGMPFAEGCALDAVERRLTSVERASFVHGESVDLRISGYLHDPWEGDDERLNATPGKPAL